MILLSVVREYIKLVYLLGLAECRNIRSIAFVLLVTSLYQYSIIIMIIIIIIKKYWQCKAGRGRLTPYQSEDPSHTLPIYRGKEEKGKIVEGKKGESN